ncbi:MAG: Signal transduction histidine-protein kinase/phosphatase DegS [Candidatus Dichloromethanomonas elyunquensis]|nr:MAG: Signal transduction histidine-protein kinase/phosphatase DegS [Candidatus Dichloromethanomonas elyunquensis]
MDRLSDVFEATLKAVEDGKEEIFNIYEITRSEVQRLKKELEFLSLEISETIRRVDNQLKDEKSLRQKLMEVNRNFKNFNEKQMLDIYSQAKDAQVELKLLQAKELQLRTRRDEIERSLKNLDGTVQRAENLMNQVGLAIRLLKEGITEISQLYSNDQRKEIAFRIIKAQEEERRRIAREVHDGPAQSLANIVLRLEIAEKLLMIDHDQVKKEIQELNNQVRENLRDIRRIIFDLRPIQLESSGIIETIKNYIKNYQKTYGIECELIVDGVEKQLNPSLEVALFRLVQEGMTNVAKHADTSKCEVVLQFLDDWIIGQIIDQGRGFNTKEVLTNPGEHFGLIGINERIDMYSGKFTIKSVQGEGTVFEFGLPYAN